MNNLKLVSIICALALALWLMAYFLFPEQEGRCISMLGGECIKYIPPLGMLTNGRFEVCGSCPCHLIRAVLPYAAGRIAEVRRSGRNTILELHALEFQISSNDYAWGRSCECSTATCCRRHVVIGDPVDGSNRDTCGSRCSVC